MSLIDRILELDTRVILEPPAGSDQLEAARPILPPLLLELLERSNGGEFSFCRFQPSPYLPEASQDLWEHVANSYPPSDLIDRREFLPLGDDYGDGLYCLNFRQNPTSVTFVPFYATSEDEFELAAETFEAFLEQALADLEEAATIRSTTVHIDLSRATDSPELAELGVRFRFVDRALVVEAERSSPFPDERQLRLYQDESRSVFFTLEALVPGVPPIRGDGRGVSGFPPISGLLNFRSEVAAKSFPAGNSADLTAVLHV